MEFPKAIGAGRHQVAAGWYWVTIPPQQQFGLTAGPAIIYSYTTGMESAQVRIWLAETITADLQAGGIAYIQRCATPF